jgi:hypothetical protein
MGVCFAALVLLPALSGPAVATFLAYFLIAAVAYTVAVARLDRGRLSLRTVWAFAILFRLTMLLTDAASIREVILFPHMKRKTDEHVLR